MLKRRSNAHRKSRVAYLASKQGLKLCAPALFLCPLRYAMSKNGRCGSPVSEKPLETETQFLKTEALGHSFVPLCRVVGPLGRFLLDNRDAALHSVGALVRVRPRLIEGDLIGFPRIQRGRSKRAVVRSYGMRLLTLLGPPVPQRWAQTPAQTRLGPVSTGTLYASS